MSPAYVLKRLAMAIPTLFGVAIVVFVLLRVVPGDPIAMMIPPGARAEDIENLRALYGLDRPILVQFGHWLLDMVSGNFGTSISLRQSVLGLVMSRLPATLELSGTAIALATALGILLGVASVYWRGRWPELVVDAVSGFAMAIPDFLWGLLFVLGLGVLWPILPISGRLDPRLETNFTTGFYLLESVLRGELDITASLLTHLVLPAVALALPLTAAVARILKSALKEAMSQDYILMARAKGFSKAYIIWREAFRNALVPTVTLSGVQLTFLVGGTVLIERIFSYPGIGNMAIGAVIDRDLPLIQGLVLTFAVLFIALNLVIDMTYVLLNPRVRHG
ncbi:MAG TPA: ABC transporter permease [Stellaceae bacterium]|nr:ABC transporter permease [Stellaceae bacterium]